MAEPRRAFAGYRSDRAELIARARSGSLATSLGVVIPAQAGSHSALQHGRSPPVPHPLSQPVEVGNRPRPRLYFAAAPKWRNGRRSGLKIRRP